MIIDRLENAALYTGLHAKLGAGFAFLSRAIAEGLAPGKYELEGEALYATVQEYESFADEGRVFEGHRKYIDLQCIVSGRERMDVTDISRATEIKPYDEAIDAALFAPDGRVTSSYFAAGDFAIYFPHDVHRPGCRADGVPETVKKIVVKLEI